MQKLFENWRKHLNEGEFYQTLEAFKEKHPELNIGETASGDDGHFYIQFDGEYEKATNDDGTTIRDEEELYQYLRKRAGY